MINLFINPFEQLTDRQLLSYGLLIFAAMVLLGWQWEFVADGIVQLHHAPAKPLWKVLINQSINLFSLSLLMFLFGKLSYAKTRFIDVFNVVLIANFTQLLVILVLLNPWTNHILLPVEKAILEGDILLKSVPKQNLIVLGIAGFFAIGMLYYFFHLLVLGMKLAMNSKKVYQVILIVLLTLLLDSLLKFTNPYL